MLFIYTRTKAVEDQYLAWLLYKSALSESPETVCTFIYILYVNSLLLSCLCLSCLPYPNHFPAILPTSLCATVHVCVGLCVCVRVHAFHSWKPLGAAQAGQMEELACPCSTVLNLNACSQRFGSRSVCVSFLLALAQNVRVRPIGSVEGEWEGG